MGFIGEKSEIMRIRTRGSLFVVGFVYTAESGVYWSSLLLRGDAVCSQHRGSRPPTIIGEIWISSLLYSLECKEAFYAISMKYCV